MSEGSLGAAVSPPALVKNCAGAGVLLLPLAPWEAGGGGGGGGETCVPPCASARLPSSKYKFRAGLLLWLLMSSSWWGALRYTWMAYDDDGSDLL